MGTIFCFGDSFSVGDCYEILATVGLTFFAFPLLTSFRLVELSTLAISGYFLGLLEEISGVLKDFDLELLVVSL